MSGIKNLEVHKGENIIKSNEKSEGLYKILEQLPDPPAQANLSDGAKFWWYWLGKEFVATRKISNLDLTHLQSAAFWLDQRCQAIGEIKRKGYYGGTIQVFQSGAQNITGHMTVVKDADKALDNISSHFGLSLRDRKKLQVEDKDPDQMDLFAAFLNKKSV
jgi:phage terminase small subunit